MTTLQDEAQPLCCAFHQGPVTRLARLAVGSWLRLGYRCRIYVYGDMTKKVPLPVPAEYADANELMPASEAAKLSKESWRVYKGLQLVAAAREPCIWLSTDTVLTNPLPDGPFCFGTQTQLLDAPLRLPLDLARALPAALAEAKTLSEFRVRLRRCWKGLGRPLPVDQIAPLPEDDIVPAVTGTYPMDSLHYGVRLWLPAWKLNDFSPDGRYDLNTLFERLWDELIMAV